MLSSMSSRMLRAVPRAVGATVSVRLASTTDGSGLLNGKNVLVTGATSGIGWHAALDCAAAGANVLACGRRADRGKKLVDEILKLGGRAEFRVADVSKEEDCRSVVDDTVSVFGSIDGAFNNAGIAPKPMGIMDMTEEHVMGVWRVNVLGVLYCMKYQMKAMCKNENGGSIVNNSSIAGFISGEGMAAYASSKHAVQALSGAAASEGAPHKIRVNTVNPGPIHSEIWGSMFSENVEDAPDAVAQLVKMRRAGFGNEVGQPVVFLLSDGASYITAASLTIDGGFVKTPFPPLGDQ